MSRQPLGRGLNALLGGGEATQPATEPETGTFEISIDLIDPNPEQPRTRFADANLEELVQSIRVNGVLQPIVLRQRGGRYQIVAGERRWRAAQRAELRKIPAFVKDVSDEKMLELALVENIQRQELNPMEEANAYRKLIENIGLTQEMVAERVGKDRTVISTSLRLLRLSNDLQHEIEEGNLSVGHARALLMTEDPKIRRDIANSAIENGWSVRDIEKAIKRITTGPRIGTSNMKAERILDANAKVAETKLMRRLSTNVKILPGKKGIGGKIEIEYYSTDDLDRLYDLLMDKQL